MCRWFAARFVTRRHHEEVVRELRGFLGDDARRIEMLKAELRRVIEEKAAVIAGRDAESDRSADLAADLAECEDRWRREARAGEGPQAELRRLRADYRQAAGEIQRHRRERLARCLRSNPGGVVTSAMIGV